MGMSRRSSFAYVLPAIQAVVAAANKVRQRFFHFPLSTLYLVLFPSTFLLRQMRQAVFAEWLRQADRADI